MYPLSISCLREKLHIEPQADNQMLKLVLTGLLAWVLLWSMAPTQAETTISVVSSHLSCDQAQLNDAFDYPCHTHPSIVTVEQRRQSVEPSVYQQLFTPLVAFSTSRARAPPVAV